MHLNENLADLMLGWTETKPQILSAGACLLEASDWDPDSLAECGAQEDWRPDTKPDSCSRSCVV